MSLWDNEAPRMRASRCRAPRRTADGAGAGRRPGKMRAAAGLVSVIALTAAGCAGSSTSGRSEGTGRVGDSLTFAYAAAPPTLDPGKADQAFAPYIQPAYDPLIRYNPDGSFAPALATEWRYVGAGNKIFEMTIREGVKYSDGSPLSAASVKTYLEYARDAHGSSSGFLQGAKIENPTADMVRISLAKPYPLVPFMLSQYNTIGSPVSPAALKTPDKLGKATAGAGQYQLDPEATVAGDHYTYTPNPHYWNKDAVHYKKLIIRVITNPNSALNAMKTKQVDAAVAPLSIARGAKAAGLELRSAPLLFQGLVLADRAGKLFKPLGDVRVRRALNYAVDRKAVTKAVAGEFGTPAVQTVPRGSDAYIPELEDFYPYDPAKARQLLTEAGYPNGFTLDVLSTQIVELPIVAQAIAGQLAQVGVKVNIVSKETNTYVSDLQAGKYPAAATALGAGPMPFEYAFLFSPDAPFNPFHSTHPTLTRLSEQMLTADEKDRIAIDRQIERFLVEQAWLLTVTFTPLIFYSQPDIGGVDLSAKNPLATITDLHPKQ